MTYRTLWTVFAALLLAGCGGGGGGGGNANPLDLDGDGLLRYPFGIDLDDDGDGLNTFLAGGTDYDDTSANVQANGGTGSFGTATPYAVGQEPSATALGDWNGDGHLDMVSTSQEDVDLTLYFGVGDGTFANRTTIDLPGDDGGGDVVTGDFNEDGALDLFASHKFILLGDGAGGFGSPTEFDLGDVGNVWVRDLNHDGHLDLVSGDFDFGITVGLGVGNGTFLGPTRTLRPDLLHIAVADFNEDGNLDAVATALGGDEFTLFLGDGAGGFNPTTSIALPPPASNIVAADVNEDGHEDVVVYSINTTNIHVLLGDGTGAFGAPVTTDTGLNTDDLLLLHLLGSERDLVGAATGGYYIARGLGDGSFAGPAGLPAVDVNDATAGDLNHDGILDLVFTDFGADTILVVLGE